MITNKRGKISKRQCYSRYQCKVVTAVGPTSFIVCVVFSRFAVFFYTCSS
jgi:hypothetical protein